MHVVACAGEETYQAPAPGEVDLQVDPNSSRLQLLEPFKAWDGKDIEVCVCMLTCMFTRCFPPSGCAAPPVRCLPTAEAQRPRMPS